MRWRAGIGAALLAAVAWGPFASAAPSNALVVTAARSASVDFTLSTLVSPTGERPTLRGGGRYAAIFIDALDDRESYKVGTRVYAAARLTDVSDDVHMLAIPDRLPPGRYRATVLAERSVEVVIRFSDGVRGPVLRASRPVAARLATTSTTRDAAATDGRTALEARLPAAVPTGFEGVLATRVSGQRVDTSRVCAATAGHRCPSRLLPFSFPSAFGALDTGAGNASFQDGAGARTVLPSASARDAVASLDGVRNGRTALVLAALSWRKT